MSGEERNGTGGSGFAGAGHPGPEQLDQYRSRSLNAETLASVDRHLGECAGCRQLLLARTPAGAVRLPEEVLAMKEPLHLSYEQISSYVDGALLGTEKDRVEEHVFICASCSREIEDLRRLDQQLALPAEETAEAPNKVSVFEKLSRFFAMPGRVREFGLAMGAIVAGIFVLVHADRTGRAPILGQGESAKLIYLGSGGHAGFALGGFLLIVAGVLFAVYSIRRKK